MDFNDIAIKNRDKLASYYANLVISQYNTEKNIKFLKDIMLQYLQYDTIGYDNYFDFENSNGQHLTEIFVTLYSIYRSFDGITLTDDELKIIGLFAIVKNNIKILSLETIETILYTIFNNKIHVNAYYNVLQYFIDPTLLNTNILKAIIKYKLLPIPFGSKVSLYKTPPVGYRYFSWSETKNYDLNINIFAPWSDISTTDYKIIFMEETDIIYKI